MKKSVLLLSALASTLPAAAGAGEGTITIPKKISFKKGINVPDAVRAECNLETRAAEIVRDGLKGFDKVTLADHVSKGTPGKALEMSITGLLAPGGGRWSGPKSVTIEGVLYSGGKSLGNFKAMRHTTHGATTCGMLERDINAIADDIAQWLKAPKADSRLGDA